MFSYAVAKQLPFPCSLGSWIAGNGDGQQADVQQLMYFHVVHIPEDRGGRAHVRSRR